MQEQSVAPKKVIIFSLSYYPMPISGAEAAIHEITNRIEKDDIEFHLICNGYNNELPKVEQHVNVCIHRIGLTTKNPQTSDLRRFPLHLNKFLYQFLAAAKAAQLHRKHTFDGIWCMMPHSAGVPSILFRLLHPKLKYIVTLEEGDSIEHIEKSVRPMWPLFTRVFTKADVIHAISKYLYGWAEQRNATCPIFLIPNGANPKNLAEDYSKDEAYNIKEKLGKKEGDIFLLIVARLVHQKAQDDIIHSLKLLPGNISLVIVGGGVDEQMLKELTKNEGLEDRVHFIGQLTRDEVPLYRNKIVADIFVHPSRSEGLGHSMLSAMAGRLPVVTTQVGGLSDFIFDAKRNPDMGTTAWAVDPDSPEQIAQAVKDIIANPAKTKEVTDRARTMVETQYNWDTIAQRMRTDVFGILFK